MSQTREATTPEAPPQPQPQPQQRWLQKLLRGVPRDRVVGASFVWQPGWMYTTPAADPD